MWAHATWWLERSGGAAEGERRLWTRACASILARVIDGDDGVGLTVRRFMYVHGVVTLT